MRIVSVLTSTLLLFSASSAATERAVFAGGCFWGVEAVFEELNGVKDVRSGYTGGTGSTADYDSVSSGRTKHAESVEVRFDPAVITYEQLLNVFFIVAHDPTQVDRQGPDIGPQYRSAIFYATAAQRSSAEKFIAALETSKAFPMPIATKLEKLTTFYTAEAEHQDFVRRNPRDAYVVAHDLPKLEALKKTFPNLLRSGTKSARKR
jgi:peptide-methionine (S)-S-oxide reductase